VEAAPRFDRRAHHQELGAAFDGHPGDLVAEAARTGAYDLPPHADAVRGREGGRRLEPLLEHVELAVEMGIQRQLAIDDERRDQHDPRAAVGGEPAGEVEGVFRLLALE